MVDMSSSIIRKQYYTEPLIERFGMAYSWAQFLGVKMSARQAYKSFEMVNGGTKYGRGLNADRQQGS